MAAGCDALHDLIDRLPDHELSVAQRFLEFLSQVIVGQSLGRYRLRIGNYRL